jgi:trans-2,3-dihydro-3-hydroxyanthranilate isomerase
MSHRFHTLDVFTTSPLAGNPLAVVHDADDLSTVQMQTIAAEFNLAETVFVCQPKDPVNTARIRIFTTTSELPFAGHPTVGTAVLIARLRAPDMLKAGIHIVLEETAGLVPCDVRQLPSGETRAVFSAPKISEELVYQPDVAKTALALGIDAAAIGFDAHRVSLWSAGVPFVHVPLSSLDALAKARIADREAWDAVAGKDATGFDFFAGIYCYARGVEGQHDVRSRMFTPNAGMPEDPATGSAAAAFAGAAVAFEKPKDGTHQLLIGQGYEMGRPSDIALDITIDEGQLEAVQIGGAAVIVSEGTLFL